MTVCIFSGPTLTPEEIRAELDAVCLPPVSQGDVHQVSLHRPRAIGIIDGYFERVPAVWHKEILSAMTRGIHVFGSASMGALRAAELAPFGMEGVGRIFERYQDGSLEDDDEVAVAHGQAENDYRPLSEAMVNIRATLAEAEAAGVLGPVAREALETIAKSLFYPDRAYPLVLKMAAAAGVPADELDALHRWLPGGRVDAKRQDALAMLRVMRERLASDPGPKRVSFTLEHTHFWEHLIRHPGVAGDTLLDELNREGATTPRKAKPTAKSNRKTGLRDLPAGRKARSARAGALVSSAPPRSPDVLKPGLPDTLGGTFTCIPES